jgi:hypothetical protein
MKIRQDVSKHCIETAIRKQYHSQISRYFRIPEEREQLQTRMAVLINAMEHLDIPHIKLKTAMRSTSSPDDRPEDIRCIRF